MVETKYIEAVQSLLPQKIDNYFPKIDVVKFINRRFVRDHLLTRNVSLCFILTKRLAYLFHC